jgi:hypothetical protein
VNQSQPFQLSATVKLDGSGNGTAQLGPQSAVRWEPSLVAIQTVNQSITTVPSCAIYSGSSPTASNLIDQTYNGQNNSSTKIAGQVLYQGQNVFAVWTGGVPGDTATLRVSGNSVAGYR